VSRERERALERWESTPWEDGDNEFAAVQLANEALHAANQRRYRAAFRAGYDAGAKEAAESARFLGDELDACERSRIASEESVLRAHRAKLREVQALFAEAQRALASVPRERDEYFAELEKTRLDQVNSET